MRDLGDKIIMTHCLSILHNPYNASLFPELANVRMLTGRAGAHLDLMTTLLVHLFLSLFPLLGRLDFTCHLHNLDLGKWASE